MENIEWKPKGWLSFLLAVVSGPFAFLYANSAKLFLSLLTVILSIAIASFYFSINEIIVRLVTASLCLFCVWFFIIRNDKPRETRKWYSKWWWGLWILFIVLIIVVRSFLYEPFRIKAASMSPAFNPGDTLIVSKRCYGSYGTFGVTIGNSLQCASLELKRGYIYAFRKAGGNTVFLKRLVGLPGDKVEIKNNQLYLNGNKVEKQFLTSSDGGEIYQEQLDGVSYEIKKFNTHNVGRNFETIVPNGHYFLLGDNRDNSADSRHFGGVEKVNFVGQVTYVIKVFASH